MRREGRAAPHAPKARDAPPQGVSAAKAAAGRRIACGLKPVKKKKPPSKGSLREIYSWCKIMRAHL